MTQEQPTESLDCIGLYCPQPLFQAKQAIESIGPGEILEVLADDPGAEKDIKAFTRRTGHTFISSQRLPDGSNRILIRRKEN